MSLYVTGLEIGTVTWASDPIAGGVIPQRCLERAGWGQEQVEKSPERIPEKLWRTLVADRGPTGDVPTYYQRACEYCLKNRTENGHINTKELLKSKDFMFKTNKEAVSQQSIFQDYLERVQAVTWNRSFLQASPREDGKTTPHGTKMEDLLGLGPPETQISDVVAILYGCSVPYILRPKMQYPESNSSSQGYESIDEAYIYGKMEGEARDDTHVEKKFRLM